MYKAKFNTEHLTADDIRNTYNFGMPSEGVLELQATAHRNVHGIEVIVAEWVYSPEAFSILSHDDESDSKMKELIWSIEQGVGFYCNDRERFDKDWIKGESNLGDALHFVKELFENVEFIKEVV